MKKSKRFERQQAELAAEILKAHEAPWYRTWRGDKKFLPQSEGQGKLLAKQELAPIKAQICMYFGIRDGGLNALQEGAQKLQKGEPVLCQECGNDIWQKGHKKDCVLVQQYLEVMAGPYVEEAK